MVPFYKTLINFILFNNELFYYLSLNVLRIINEPTAAAIAYGLDKKG